MTAKRSYYDFAKLLSFNAVYNFLCGGRGLGKTYGAKKKAISDAIKKGHQFVYVRRYKNELSAAKSSFFADLQAKGEFPNFDFRVQASYAQYAPIGTRDEKKRTWTTIGYFVALSTAASQKSVAYPLVRTIIFDEFIIEKSVISYLPNEVIAFNEFYSTVDRYEDRVRVFFLANSVSIMNPYFINYEIWPDDEREIYTKDGGFVCVHFPKAEDFASEVMQTRFGRFIAGSEYADYAVGNAFADNHDAMLKSKDPDARPLFALETKNGTFSVWLNMFTGEYHIQEKVPNNLPVKTMVASKMDSHKTFLTFSDRPLASMRTGFRHGRVAFDKQATRNTFAEIFNR